MRPLSPLRRLWREFIAPHKGDIALLAPTLAVVAAAAVSYPLIIKFTIDAIRNGQTAAIVLAPLAVIAVTAIRAAAMWGQALLSQGLALKVLRDLQGAMFAKLIRADFARFAREDAGKLVSRFTNDITVVGEGVVRGGQVAIRDSLTLIGGVASMFYYDWALTLMVAAVFLIAYRPLLGIAKRAREQTRAAQVQIGALTALLVESFSAARFVKSYGLEQRETGRARDSFEERRRIAFKLAHNRARTEPLLELLGGAALALVLYVAGLRISSGAMSLGDLVAMITAVGVATPAARSLGGYSTLLNEALAALTRIFGLIDEPSDIVDRPGAKPLSAPRGRIEFDQVSFSYGEAPALDQVSFTAEPGQTIALVGPSGAGKSTVFNLIPRLYDVTGGAVRVDGADVRDIQVASLRGAIALVSQEAALFNDSIAANIRLGRLTASDDEVRAAAAAAAADEFIRAMPEGYASMAGERGGNLSGGQRQRIALARAFLRDAPILLLDEATSALDSESEARVQEALARLKQGRTTLVIAHRLATIRDADRILVLDAGRIVETGVHDDLMRKSGLYARLSALQFAS